MCAEGYIPAGSIDLKMTLNVYNLCFWIGNRFSYVYLQLDPPVVAKVYYTGKYQVFAESCGSVDELVENLLGVLGARLDISEFLELAKEDRILSLFAERYSGWRPRSTSLWWALVVGICQQNASFKQGWRMLHEIVKSYGRTVKVGDSAVPRPPTPREVLGNTDALLHAGVGYRAKTIINAAEALSKPDFTESVLESPPREAEELLKSIKGVGSYTARLAIAFSMRRYELPPVDRWLRKVASIAYMVDEKAVEEYWVEKWGKWSALAAIATTVALDAEPLSKAVERVKRGELLPEPSKKPSPVNMKAFCV